MQEFKYKGIDLKKIKEVQKYHNDRIPPEMRIERIDFYAMMENLMKDEDFIKREIEKLAERHAENFDIVIICEMAKRFLEQEIEKIQTQEPKRVKLDWMKKFKGIWNVKKEKKQ